MDFLFSRNTSKMNELDYRAVYVETLRSAPVLGDALFAKVSSIQAMRLTDDYLASPIKIMIMGQETYGNNRHIRDVPNSSDRWLVEEFNRQIQEESHFDFAYGKDPEFSRWWKAYGEICSEFGLSSRRATVWTNISKVQLADNDGYGVSVSKLNASDKMNLLRWQRQLLLAELQFAQPDVLIMMTGGLSWMARHIFQNGDGGLADEVSIPGAPPNTRGISAISLGSTLAGYTLHPASRRHRDAELRTARGALLSWLKQGLDARTCSEVVHQNKRGNT
ncbi:hypothetical protein DXT90_07760 [Agrobacterium tumefaciens]|nr:hypothetical protein [Agrobacterium tumefaciens]